MVGVRSTAVLTNFFTVGKLIPLLVFILIGLFYLHPQSFTYGETPHYTSFGSAILILLYAFVGFEVAVIPAGEAKDPHRDFPFALLVGLAIVAVIYVVVQIVCVGTLPQLASSERPITDAASNFLGPVGAGLITAGALISILGNLNVGMLAGSRILYAMAARSELPRQLAAIHPRFHTPYVAVIFNSLVIGVLTIYSSFLSALAVATVTRLLIYATTCVALPVFRRRTDIHEAGFRLPFGLLIPLLSLGLIVWLLTNVDFTKEGLPIIVATVAGFVLFWVAKVFRKS